MSTLFNSLGLCTKRNLYASTRTIDVGTLIASGPMSPVTDIQYRVTSIHVSQDTYSLIEDIAQH